MFVHDRYRLCLFIVILICRLYAAHNIKELPVNFATWMGFGIPFTIVLLIIAWIWLQILYLRCAYVPCYPPLISWLCNYSSSNILCLLCFVRPSKMVLMLLFFFSYLQRESPCFPLNVEYLTKELLEYYCIYKIEHYWAYHPIYVDRFKVYGTYKLRLGMANQIIISEFWWITIE